MKSTIRTWGLAIALATALVFATSPRDVRAVEIKGTLLPPGVKLVLSHSEAQDYLRTKELVPPPYRIGFDVLGEGIRICDKGNGVNIHILVTGTIFPTPR